MKKGSKMTIEQRERLSLAHLGQAAWNKGKPWSYAVKKKLSDSHRGQIAWNKGTKGLTKGWPKGKKMSEEHRCKLSLSHRGKNAGSKHHNWKGGISSESHKLRDSLEYREWRMTVLRRDRFTCVMCGFRSKQSRAAGYDKCDIRVDHIKPFSLFPELRFEPSNGRTLCIPCDKKYGWNFKRGN